MPIKISQGGEDWFQVISKDLGDKVESIKHQAQARSFEIANVLRNNELMVLRGQRSGRRYRVPGTLTGKDKKGRKRKGVYYTASAPGEPPAVRTGALRQRWVRTVEEAPHGDGVVYLPQIKSAIRIGNGQLLADLLENGSPAGKLQPRPFKKLILEKTMPIAQAILKRPYNMD